MARIGNLQHPGYRRNHLSPLFCLSIEIHPKAHISQDATNCLYMTAGVLKSSRRSSSDDLSEERESDGV
jgi:hypothetical protein